MDLKIAFLLLLRHGGLDCLQFAKGEDAKMLGQVSRRAAKLAEKYWSNEFQNVIKKAKINLSLARTVLYPFSGADVWSALAVQPNATEYILIDQWPVNRSVRTRKMDQSELIAKVLTAQSGFQFGHLIKHFALRYGMAPLLIGAIGALDMTLRRKEIFNNDELVLYCQRSDDSTFILRYYALNIYSDDFFFKFKQISFTRHVLTLLKATELALSKKNLQLTNLGKAPNALALITASHRRDQAASHATDAILKVSDFIIQDLTGIPMNKLIDWASTIHLFGAYADLYHSGPDAADLDALFLANRHRIHSLGHLRFGYCLELHRHSTSLTLFLAKLKEHASFSHQRNTSFLQPAYDSFFNKRMRMQIRRLLYTDSDVDHYCHMLLACRRINCSDGK
mmetsp:Transcript_16106/g.21079  ORF Transcript_16106/g.21079 Transcript_16106/m.21079 type:complete len:394 (-) Transcript_16106:296-1477(-)